MIPRRVLVSLLLLAFLAGRASASTQLIGTDSIGPDSSATDFNGGFAALQAGLDTPGQPAVEISQNGSSLLDSMRVIVHGHESFETGVLAFNFFDYRLNVWTKANYLAGLNPEIVAHLGEPIGVALIEQSPNTIVPSEAFGEASYDPQSFSLPSYDFRFDLTAATLGGSTDLAFAEPLPAGDYIIAFQSHHNGANGGLYVSLSTIGQGLAPYYYQNVGGMNEHPRGILVGQSPPYAYRWGWNIFQSPAVPGDYDFDGDADGADFLKWQRALGTNDSLADGDDSGTVDGQDLAIWEAHFGETAGATPTTTRVPEPTAAALGVLALLAITGRVRLPPSRSMIERRGRRTH